jgi:hypothetical protein
VDDAGGSDVRARAAVLLGHGDAEQAHVAKLAEERLVEPVVPNLLYLQPSDTLARYYSGAILRPLYSSGAILRPLYS